MDAATRALADPDALSTYLKERLGEQREVSLQRLTAGKSNETFYLDWGPQRWVLRRPPAGPLPPTAHDVLREYRVLSALDGRRARAPRTVLSCADPSIIGVPFYIMEYVPGPILLNDPAPYIDDHAQRWKVGEQMVESLVEVHAVDWQAAGLEGFGKPEGFVRRQVRRRMDQLDSIMVRCRQLPEMIQVHDWLEANLPPECTTPTIVHGDYGLHNVIFNSEQPKAAAIVDWELSSLGDPLTDLGWLTAMWQQAGDPVDSLEQGFAITASPGFPGREDLVEMYRERSGREVHDLVFYRVLSIWRLAIALEGSYARYKLGVTDHPYFETLEQRVPSMARRCLRLIAGEGV